MLELTFAALLATTPVQDPAAAASPPQTVAQEPVDLDDIDVVGRPLDTMIRSFVNEVAAPNRRRGIARWDDEICIGVANLRDEPAQYLVDRVSTIAGDVGLTAGRPGCRPNVMIIASDDPDGLAQTLVDERDEAFRIGGSGMDQGGAALRRFVASDRPVRWWQVSMPVDSETGLRVTRIPGECSNSCQSVADHAPAINVFAPSRLSTQIVDSLFRTVVILDVEQVSQVSRQQLADYVAMITLAQINPEADTTGYASILNVFEDPEGPLGLTNWDIAYLDGLYDAERTRRNLRASRTEIIDSISRAHGDLQAGEEAQAEEEAASDEAE
jgi:hypothetical protein